MVQLGIVVPCHNEAEVLRETTSRLTKLLDRLFDEGRIGAASCVYYVDDGSTDATWQLIRTLAQEYPRVAGIKLSRNRGHQNALLAGLLNVPGDAVVSIDADLQDDVTAIERMVEQHARGADIVYGVRDDRSSDTRFKRWTAQVFYRLMAYFGVDIIYNHADYRLMSRRAIDALRNYNEVNLFLRGVIPLLGFNSATVRYSRGERFAGTSKYPLRRMLSLAWQGVTSFSVTPLRFVTGVGAVVFAITLLISLYTIAVRLFTAQAVPGWASTVLPIYLLGGLQILAIGILGEYLGKVYQEVKARPRFLIEEMINGVPQVTHSSQEVTSKAAQLS